MFVSDVYEEAKIVLGRCQDAVIFRRISDAVKLANNQSKADIAMGIVDLWVCNGFITLPPDVYTILGVNHDGWPTLIRDQWYQFHVNGTGLERWQPWTFTDELGPVCTFNDPQVPCAISAVVENPADSNCLVRVFGWDLSEKRIYTPDPVTGNLVDGFLVPTTYGYQTSNPAAPPIAKIDRVQKALTQGYVQLFASDPQNVHPTTMIGYYQPWETVPSYRRIRVPNCLWVRIKYKRRDLDVRGVNDWINIDNREALIMLIKAVKFRMDNQIEMAKNYETEGMRLFSNEVEALRPPGLNAPQVIFADGIDRCYVRDELNLHY